MTLLADPMAGTMQARSGLVGRMRQQFRQQGASERQIERAMRQAFEVAARDTSVAWMTFMGIPQNTDGIDKYSNAEDFGKAPADEAWVYACVARIFNAAASVPLRVYRRRGNELVPAENEPSTGASDLQRLLDNPNPVDMTGAELRAYSAASRKIWGGWYWQRVRGRYGGSTQELYWLRVPDVTPHSDDGRKVDWYEHRAKLGATDAIAPRDMVRRRMLNMGGLTEMLSPLSAARYDMVVGQSAPMHTAAILKNRGVPEGYWTEAKGTELARPDKSAITRFVRSLRGPKNAGRSLVAPGVEYKALSLPEKDAEWLAGRKVARMTVCAVLGTPLALAGDVENSGFYRSTLDAERVFWRDTMVTELNGDAEVINTWLVPEFGEPDLVVAHDFSEVEALRPEWQTEWDGWLAGIDAQAITGNQFRRHFRLGPDLPWGDKPTPRTQVALRPDPAVLANIDLPVMTDLVAEPERMPAPEVQEPGGGTGDEADLPASLRTIGKRFYAQLAVRAYIAHGGPLDAEGLLGVRMPDAARLILEDGIRRRQSSEQIAARLEGYRGKKDAPDATAAVLAALRKQWPEEQLDIVRQGEWEYVPAFPMKKIDAARRPIARNPTKVAGVEAALKLGAPIDPVILIDRKAIGQKDTEPIDGWHRTLAAEHQGLKDIPAFVGKGDEQWTKSLLAFNETIPTPPDDAGARSYAAQDDERTYAFRVPAPVVNVPAPVVNIAAPVVHVAAPAPVVVPPPVVNIPPTDIEPFTEAVRSLEREVKRPRRTVVQRDEAGKIVGAVNK